MKTGDSPLLDVKQTIEVLDALRHYDQKRVSVLIQSIPALMDAIDKGCFDSKIAIALQKGVYMFNTFDEVSRIRRESDPVIRLDVDPLPSDAVGGGFPGRVYPVLEHRTMPAMRWDPSKISLHLSPSSARDIDDEWPFVKLHEDVKNLPCYNGNMLDFLLLPHNQYLIPSEWKHKRILFFGTVYGYDGDERSSSRYVRSLHYSCDGIWEGDLQSLECHKNYGAAQNADVAIAV